MKQMNYDTVEIVHKRMEVMEYSRRRAFKNRMKQIEKLVTILRRMVLAAAVLMIMAGACVIDAAPTAEAEFPGCIMMLGGLAAVVVSSVLFQGEAEGGWQ